MQGRKYQFRRYRGWGVLKPVCNLHYDDQNDEAERKVRICVLGGPGGGGGGGGERDGGGEI